MGCEARSWQHIRLAIHPTTSIRQVAESWPYVKRVESDYYCVGTEAANCVEPQTGEVYFTALVSTTPATIASLWPPKQLVITPHSCLQRGILLLQKVQLVPDFLQLIILLSTAGRDIRVMCVHPELGEVRFKA